MVTCWRAPLVAPLVLLQLLCLTALNTATPMGVTGNLATNEIMELPPPQEVELPLCRAGSACGYVQVNAYGVNVKPFCRCPRRTPRCNLHWDPQDGRSVTTESEQYKFCDSAPKLHQCGRDERAYTMAMVFDNNFMQIAEMHHLKCDCKSPRSHQQAEIIEDQVDDEMIMAIVSTCSQLPVCEEAMSCKEISFAQEATLVMNKCRCPRGLVCPTQGSHTSSKPHTNTYPMGQAFSIYCQTIFS
ncbi:unnamed protein product [Meganyctiphanes norvegica]|uniref:Uncharacterized protein n=1 Tax=Meganyctiphanes norvegica TaxID=48144 RepID=A0AAV2RX30_MEGNR